MNYLNLFILLSFALVMGCSEDACFDEPSSDSDEFQTIENADLKSAHGKPVTRTIKFKRSSGTGAYIYPSDVCPDNMQLSIQGDGIASHLGHFTVTNSACLSLTGEFISPITGILTAANGDQIFTMVVNSYTGSDGLSYYDYTVIDGNGRFEGITGDMTMYGTFDPVTLDWNLKGEGTITY